MEAFFRILTSEGRGAIAVVRVRGPGALAVADAAFRPDRGQSLGRTGPGRLRLGRAGRGEGDQVVAVRLEVGMPTVEIQCHGGAAAVASVARALEDAGAMREPADPAPGEDRLRAQALQDLAAAPTLRSAEILLDQVHGALSRSLETLISEARNRVPLGPRSPLLADLDALIRRADVGTRLVVGWKVVIAGRPNVGKSRLFNALAGFDRSIVDPRAGVTRDVVSLRTAFGGWPVELSDTAGERDSEDAVERLGIGRARRERDEADLVLLVLDRSEPLGDVDRRLLEGSSAALIAANKCDLTPAWEMGVVHRGGIGVLPISAGTGEGLEDLVRELASRLVPDPPAAGVAVPFRAEHLRSLEEARACLLERDLDGLTANLEAIGRPGPLSQ